MKRKIFAVLVTFILVISLSMTSMAATWDNVDTWEKLDDAFQDTDADVIINLTGDIEFLSGLYANENQTYIINGTEYTLYATEFYGLGSVEMNTQVKHSSTGDMALSVYEEAKVTVNSDVEGSVGVGGSAEVTINGNVNAKDGEEPDEDGNLYEGNMNTPGGYSDANYSAIEAGEDAKVTVNGDVAGGDAYGSYAYASGGIRAYENASVVVSGDVTGGSVTANPDVESDDMISRAGAAVVMTSTANVEVGGDVKGGSTSGQDGEAGEGVIIYLRAAEEGKSQGQLVVKGTVIGGDATAKGGESASGLQATLFDGPMEITLEDVEDNSSFADFIVYDAVYTMEWLGNTLSMEYEEIDGYVDEFEEAIQEVYLNKTGTALPTTHSDETWEALKDTADNLGENELADFKQAMIQCFNDIIRSMMPDDLSENMPSVEVYGVQGGNDAEAISADIEDMVTQLVQEKLNYSVKVTQAVNGTVSVDKATAKTGEKVVVSAKAAEGYQVSKVLVNGKAIQAVGGEYSFTVIEGGSIEVTAEFVKAASVPKSPQTGDASQAILYMMLIVVSLGTVVITRTRMTR